MAEINPVNRPDTSSLSWKSAYNPIDIYSIDLSSAILEERNS